MEYLFRGKVKYNGHHLFEGDWIEGSLILKSSGNTFIYYVEKDGFGNIVRELEIEVHPDTVGMWTGFKDVNGKKIFSGDILLIDTKQGRTEHTVEWVDHLNYAGWMVYGKNRRWNVPMTRSRHYNGNYEVIKTIYDNPELLE